MGVTYSGLDGIAKRSYPDNKITQLSNMVAKTYKKLTVTKPLGGASSYLPVNVLGNEAGQGNIAEDGALPNGGSQTIKQVYPTAKIFTHVIDFTGLSLSMLQNNTEAFANVMTYHMDEGFKNAAKELNAQAFRDGTNKLGQASAAGTTTVTCDSGVATHFRKGMTVYYGSNYTTATSTAIVSSVTLPSSINGTYSVTFTTAAVVANDDFFVRGAIANEYDKGFEGLPAIEATSGTYQGLSKTTYPAWQGISVAAGSVNLSDAILQKAKAKMLMISGATPNTIISNTTQFRMYMADTLPQVRFDAKGRDTLPDTTYTWNGMQWVVDTDCEFDVIHLLDKDMFYLFENYALKFDDSDGKILKYIPNYDKFSAYIKTYANYGTQNCGAFCKISGLNVPIVA